MFGYDMIRRVIMVIRRRLMVDDDDDDDDDDDEVVKQEFDCENGGRLINDSHDGSVYEIMTFRMVVVGCFW